MLTLIGIAGPLLIEAQRRGIDVERLMRSAERGRTIGIGRTLRQALASVVENAKARSAL